MIKEFVLYVIVKQQMFLFLLKNSIFSQGCGNPRTSANSLNSSEPNLELFDAWLWVQLLFAMYVWLKFIYSGKTPKFCEIFPLLLTTVHTVKSKGKISQNFVALNIWTLNSHKNTLKQLFCWLLKTDWPIQVFVWMLTS